MAATRTTTASDRRVTVVSAVRAIPAWGWLTLLVVVSAVLICFVATIYPSRQAAKLDPAAALRYE